MDAKQLTMADKQALAGKLAARASELFAPMLERLYASCQTHFFELASAADSGANRPRYLGFVRDLKRGKAGLSEEFGKRLAAEFARLDGSAGRSPAPSTGVEEQRLAAAARSACGADLNELHKRLRALGPLDSREVPLDPERVLATFLDACGEMAKEGAVRVPLSSQFAQHVLGGLGTVCRGVNQVLAELLPAEEKAKPAPAPSKTSSEDSEGWLDAAFRGGAPAPDTGGIAPAAAALFGVARGSGSAAAPGAAQPGAEAGVAAGQVAAVGVDPMRDLQEISGLLARLRGVAGGVAGGVSVPGVEGASGLMQASALQPLLGSGDAPAGPAISGDQLVALLSDVQQRGAWRSGGATDGVDIRGAIEAIAAAKGKLSVGQAEQDMVDIVTMFFDVITEDRDLPSSIQASLQRLQLPVLKIALSDRTFLTDRTHPARALIDGIARVGMGWDTNSKQMQDTLLGHLNSLLDELLAHPALGIDAFKLALHKLNEHTARTDQRATKQERRTAEKAQAEARLAAAREAVHEAMRERLDGRELPAALLEFFTLDWHRVLQITWLRLGSDSAQWKDAVRAIEELVSSADPAAPAGASYEDLYRRLEAGLAMTQSNSAETQHRIDTIRALHTARTAPVAPGAPPPPPIAIARAKIEPPPAIPPRGQSPAIVHPRANEALSIESLKRVDEMPIGTWFEYEDPASKVTRRCKLSARIDETRMFLFSDRMGMPVHEKPRKQFAHELQLGLVRVIEDAPLVDRTIGRIAATLRERAAP